MADRDYRSELDQLGDEQGFGTGTPESAIARDVEGTGLLDSFGTRQQIENRLSQDETRDTSAAGVLGSWGTLDETGRRQWISDEREWAKSAEGFWSGLRKGVPEQEATELSAEDRSAAPPFARMARDLTGWASRKIDENIARAKRRQFFTDQMEAGEREAAKYGTARNVTEQFMSGLLDAGVGGMVGGAGRLAEYGGEALPSWSGGPALAWAGKNVKDFGAWISHKATQLFPKDEARQEEFSSALAQGAGSMVAFLGPSVGAAILTKAGPKTLAAMVENPALAAEVAKRQTRIALGTAGSLGSAMEGEALAREAEDAQKRGKPVTDDDVRTAFLLGLPLGATEALPLGNLFTAPEGALVRNILREAFEEGGQEFGQTLGENFVAQQYFDPERKWDDGAWEAAAVGAILGSNMEAGRRAYAKVRGTGTVTDVEPSAAPVEVPEIVPPDSRVIDLSEFSPVSLQRPPEAQSDPETAATTAIPVATPAGPSPASDDTGGVPVGIAASEVPKGGEGPTGAPAAPTYNFSEKGLHVAQVGDTEVMYGVNPATKYTEVTLVRTPDGSRQQGSARAAMEALVQEADANGFTLTLNAEPVGKGGAPKKALEAFYESLGFVRNKGKDKDFTTTAAYIRPPGAAQDTREFKPSEVPALPTVAEVVSSPAGQAVIDAVESDPETKAVVDQIASALTPQQEKAASLVERIAAVNRKAKLASLAEEAGLSLPDEVFSRSLKDIKAEIARAVEQVQTAQPTAAETVADATPAEPTAYDRFREIIASGAPLRPLQWPSRVSVAPEEMNVLVDQAIADGLLRKTKAGGLRRAPTTAATPRPRGLGEGRSDLPRINQDQVSAVRRAAASLPQQGPSSPLAIPPDVRIDRAIQTRESKTGKPVATIVSDYALRIEQARGTPGFDPIVEEIKVDRLLRKADAHDLAALVGYPVSKSTTKQAALATLVTRHQQLLASSSPWLETDSFAGSAALTADLGALSRAKRMAASGASKERIWSETGWMRGAVDGMWRFEIDDSAAKLRDRQFYLHEEDGKVYQGEWEGKLGDVLEHPKLFNAYPELRDMHVEFGFGGYYGTKGSASGDGISAYGATREEILPVLIHEIQHYIQQKEGFEQGFSPKLLLDQNTVALAEVRQAIDLAEQSGQGHNSLAILKDAEQALDASRPYLSMGWFGPSPPLEKAYNSLAGEVEARNAMTRLPMSADERRASAPWTTEDVPRGEQISRETPIAVTFENEAQVRQIINDALEKTPREARDETSAVEFNPDYVLMQIFDKGAVATFRQFEDNLQGEARTVAKAAKRIAELRAKVAEERSDAGPWGTENAQSEAAKELKYMQESIQKVGAVRLRRATAVRDLWKRIVDAGLDKPDFSMRGVDLNGLVDYTSRQDRPVIGKRATDDDIRAKMRREDAAAKAWKDTKAPYVAKGVAVLRADPAYKTNDDTMLRMIVDNMIADVVNETQPAFTGRGQGYETSYKQFLSAIGEDGQKRIRRAAFEKRFVGTSQELPRDVLMSIGALGKDGNELQGKLPIPKITLASIARVIDADAREVSSDIAAGKSDRRILDTLGFYSGLDEALKGFKPTDSVTADTLAKRGVKKAELEARGLSDLLSEGKSAKVSDLQKVAGENRVEVREAQYHSYADRNALAREHFDRDFNSLSEDQIADLRAVYGQARWDRYSLDPDNPTYRETVLHLPGTERRPGAERWSDSDFQSGHWSEPNVIAHARTSIQKDAQGKDVFVVNELQSDWGQRIRDVGVGDSEKIEAASRKAVAAAAKMKQAYSATVERNKDQPDSNLWDWTAFKAAEDEAALANAELATLKQAGPGHPLVNTTDQWVNTSLRRMITQAVESGADQIAIPSGETVISFGMGGEAKGLKYAYDQMYPKNLRNLLQKMDKSVEAKRIDHLYSLDVSTDSYGKPQSGALPLDRSHGFTTFKITDKLKQQVKENGLALFSIAGRGVPPLQPTQQFEESLPEVVERLGEELQRMLPDDVVFRITDRLLKADGSESFGEYDPVTRLVQVALFPFGIYDPVKASQINRHETIHVLRMSGLFSDQEWELLVNHAEKTKIDDSITIEDEFGKQIPGLPIYKRVYSERLAAIYANRLTALGFEGDAFDEAMDAYTHGHMQETVNELLNQERVAKMAETWAVGKVKYPSKIEALLARIMKFIEALHNALADLGFQTADDVFQNVFSGNIAARAAAPSTISLPGGFDVEGYAIRAFHGTPHTFAPEEGAPAGRFRSDKIGTGEGAQVYGHGLYFAESEGVARWYREKLKGHKGWGSIAAPFVDGRLIEVDDEINAYVQFTNSRRSLPAAIEATEKSIDRDRSELRLVSMTALTNKRREWRDALRRMIQRSEEKLRVLKDWHDRGAVITEEPPPPGTLYEVRIDAEPGQFLDWDKPLTEQSEPVRGVLKQFGITDNSAKIAELERKIADGSAQNSTAAVTLLSSLKRRQRVGALLQDKLGGEVEAQLAEAGIVGVRYLDGGSRGAGDGTSNFVIFPGNEHMIEIVAVDGQPVAQEVGLERLTLASIGRVSDERAGVSLRSAAIPRTATVIASYASDADIKSDPDYRAAKDGDQEAAARMVERVVKPENIAQAATAFGAEVTYVPVIAEEATGKNKIPELTAHLYAISTGASVTDEIIQSSRAFHTGTRPLERLIARPRFGGAVEAGRRYVLVDDVTVMGGTLAELANHIVSNGGEVAGVVTLVNASRTGEIAPNEKDIRDIEARYGDLVRSEFGIEPRALTGDEAHYIRNFRDSDALRSSVAKARRERNERLRAKGVRTSETEGGGVTLPSIGRIGSGTPVLSADTNRQDTERPDTTLSELVKSVTKALGLTVRQGRLDPGLKRSAAARGNVVAGQFSQATGVTRLAIPNDLATLAHEGGHAIEVRPSIRSELDVLKNSHVEELAAPVAQNTPAPALAPGEGFSGLEIDADTQDLARQAAEADLVWRALAASAGAAKAGGGVVSRGSYDQAAYDDAQREAATSRAALIRRLGRPTADAVIADINKAQRSDMVSWIATRYASTGTPLPRAAITATPAELSEGFAEWFRLYVTNRREAAAAAPRFFTAFEDMLEGAEPDLLESLQEIERQVEALTKASPVGALRSRVQTTVKLGMFQALRQEIADKGVGDTIGDRVYGFYHAFFDARHPMKRAVKFLLKTAEENLGLQLQGRDKLLLKAIDDPYKLWRLSEHAKVHATAALQNGITNIKAGQVDPVGPSFWDALIAAFGGKSRSAWSDENAELFGSYLVARRMLAEFQRYDRGELEQLPDQVISRDIWNRAKDQLEQQHPDFKAAATLLYAFNRNALKLKLDNGFLTQELYDDLIQRPDYVPLNRIMDDGSPSQLGKSARGTNKRRLIYKFQGSTRDFINPLESIVQDMYATQARIALNDVIRAMDRLARAAGPGGGAIAERLPANEMKGTTVDLREAIKAAARSQNISQSDKEGLLDIIDDLFDQDAAATIFRSTEINEKGEPIVYLWEGGKKVPIRLGDNRIAQDIFQGMAAMGQDNQNIIVDIAAVGTQALRAGITKAPAYIITNFLRDQIATWILSEHFTPFATGAKGLKNVIANDQTAARYSSFAGLMGGVDANLIDTAAHKRDVLTLRRKGFSAVPARSGFGQVWQTTMRSMEITEAASRFGHFEAAYQRALKDGLAPVEAAYEAAYAAHDVMDFSRRGSKMVQAARLVAFLNASLQGLDVARRTMTGERDSHQNFRELVTPYLKGATGSPLTIAEKKALPNSARFWMKAVLVGLAGLSLAALYWDDPEYEEFDDQMRATHWFFKINGTWWRYPKPFELAFFSNMFEAAFSRAWKGNERALTQFTNSLRHTMVPPHEINIMNTYYSWATGKDLFTGKAIVPTELGALPPEMQFNAYTSELGKMIGNLTGLSPAQIDQLMGSMFGTVGRDIMRFSDFALPRINQATDGALPGVAVEPRAPKSFEDTWIISRFTRRASRGSLSTRQFWEEMAQDGGKFISAAKGYENYRLAGDTRSARDMIEFLDDERKAYAYLQNEFTEREQDMHPLNRARQVMSVSSGIRKNMVLGRLFKDGTTPDARHKDREPEQIIVPPQVQTTVNEILEDISTREANNALVLINKPGWKQRQIRPVDGLLEELRKAAPEVAEEYEARLTKGKNKVYPFEGVAKVWPEAKKRLIKDGPDADLSDLRSEAANP
jgi:hypothetical protein